MNAWDLGASFVLPGAKWRACTERIPLINLTVCLGFHVYNRRVSVYVSMCVHVCVRVCVCVNIHTF